MKSDEKSVCVCLCVCVCVQVRIYACVHIQFKKIAIGYDELNPSNFKLLSSEILLYTLRIASNVPNYRIYIRYHRLQGELTVILGIWGLFKSSTVSPSLGAVEGEHGHTDLGVILSDLGELLLRPLLPRSPVTRPSPVYVCFK